MRNSSSPSVMNSSDEDETTTTASSNANVAPSTVIVNGAPAGHRASSPAAPLDQAVAGGHLISNNPVDERVDVHDSDNVATPRAMHARDDLNTDEDDEDDGSEADTGGYEENQVGRVVHNAPHDEAIDVGDVSDNEVATPTSDRLTAPVQSLPQHQRVGGGGGVAMVPDDDDEEEEEEDEADDEEEEDLDSPQQQYRPSYANQTPATIDMSKEQQLQQQQPTMPSREYDSAKYAKVNAKASREMQDLFKHILDYQPFVAELPAKLRPFIPDYIPAVGELDPFVKIPRPDGRPDGLGLYVIDEPALPQSNPAVVQLELRATNAHVPGGSAQVVDSFEDAANRPEVIDRWISDVKKVHYKKPLPTVNYQRPMPEIDMLLQAWPQMFEDVLNSDAQFPPPGIDLDLDQYIRTLCAVLDIPTHASLIDSLHVMFTLYEEFRGNQHFQHE